MQNYTSNKMEVLIVDGGSTDDTLQIARKFPVRIINNSKRCADRGNYIGVKNASGEYVIVVAADNELPTPTWLKMMVKPVIRYSQVDGVIPLPVDNPGSPGMNQYYTLIKTDPLTFFVFDSFGNLFSAYEPEFGDDEYMIFRFPEERCPLIGLAQGFMVRRELVPDSIGHDDVAPFCEMVEEGYRFAVPLHVGIHHHHLKSISHFIRKYVFRASTRSSRLKVERPLLFNKKRLVRMRLWLLYSLFWLWSTIDAIRGYKNKPDKAWFYHPLACYLTTIIYAIYSLADLRSYSNILKGKW